MTGRSRRRCLGQEETKLEAGREGSRLVGAEGGARKTQEEAGGTESQRPSLERRRHALGADGRFPSVKSAEEALRGAGSSQAPACHLSRAPDANWAFPRAVIELVVRHPAVKA